METSSQRADYADRGSRITKENLYMALALWMERCPPSDPQVTPFKKVGAVLALPNDILYAVDCSRNGVHGVARLLMKHHDMPKDCKIFVSRKPCSFCTKLLVQSQVKRVFYLPIEPEYKDLDEEKFKEEMSCVDNLFKVSPIGQATFVPKVEHDVFKSAEKKKKTETPQDILAKIEGNLYATYWNDEWMAQVKNNLPWPAFDDKMKEQVQKDFFDLFKWMAQASVGSETGYEFKALNRNGTPETIPFDPERNAELDGKMASHFITMAKLLAERTDEPTQGVGAVIINKDKDIVALGWNGFPTKALYGEFARASRHDKDVKDKKYPYSIHAEQNALLMRNTKDVVDGTLFVTKTPCDECTPLLEMLMQGIKIVVISGKMQNEQRKGLSYSKFSDKVESGVFICFETKPKPAAAGAVKNLRDRF